MDGTFLLETDRLRLRAYRFEDVDDLLAMFSDPEHMRFYPSTLDRAGTEAWVARQLERYELGARRRYDRVVSSGIHRRCPRRGSRGLVDGLYGTPGEFELRAETA